MWVSQGLISGFQITKTICYHRSAFVEWTQQIAALMNPAPNGEGGELPGQLLTTINHPPGFRVGATGKSWERESEFHQVLG